MSCVLVTWLTLALSAATYSCDEIPGSAIGLGAPGPTPHVWVERRWLSGLRRGLPGITRFRASQVFVLGHELAHARGIGDEAGANRWVVRNWMAIVVRLGGTPDKAIRLWRALGPEWKGLAA